MSNVNVDILKNKCLCLKQLLSQLKGNLEEENSFGKKQLFGELLSVKTK